MKHHFFVLLLASLFAHEIQAMALMKKMHRLIERHSQRKELKQVQKQCIEENESVLHRLCNNDDEYYGEEEPLIEHASPFLGSGLTPEQQRRLARQLDISRALLQQKRTKQSSGNNLLQSQHDQIKQLYDEDFLSKINAQ